MQRNSTEANSSSTGIILRIVDDDRISSSKISAKNRKTRSSSAAVRPIRKKSSIKKPTKVKRTKTVISKVSSKSKNDIESGFPTTLRTLRKDITFVRRFFPSLSSKVIEEVLVSTIPDDDATQESSSLADLEKAMKILRNIRENKE